MPARSGARRGADGPSKTSMMLRKKAGTVPHRKKAMFTLDEGDITGFLEDLDVNVQERCELMRFEATRRADQITNAYHRELLKLPKRIRTMQIKEFCKDYGGDVKLVMEGERLRVLQSTGFASTSPGQQPQPASVVLRSAKAISKTMAMRKARNNGQSGGTGRKSPSMGLDSSPGNASKGSTKRGGANDMRSRAAVGAFSQQKPKYLGATPDRNGAGTKDNAASTSLSGGADAMVNPRLPQTPAAQIQQTGTRTARPMQRGESLMSVNGSPIVGDSVSTSIALAIGHDPSKLKDDSAMSDEDKLETHKRLEELKNQVATLMEHLKPTSN